MDNNDTILIDRYYCNELTEAERLAFEERMAEDAGFKAEVLLRAEAVKAVRLQGRAMLKKRLQERPLIEKRPQNNLWRIIIYALLLLIPGIGWWAYNNNVFQKPPPPQPPSPGIENENQPANRDDSLQRNESKRKEQAINEMKPGKPTAPPTRQTPDQLFAGNFKPYTDKGLENYRSRGPESAPPDERYLIFYTKEQFDNTITAYEQLDPDVKDLDFTLLIKANALIETEQFAPAVSILEELCNRPISPFTDDARWYLALCKIKQGEIATAKTQLQLILKERDSTRYKQAEQLLKAIQ